MEQLTVRKLSMADVRQIYKQRLINDFPRNERRPLRMIEKLMRSGQYRCYGLLYGRHLAAYAFFILLEDGMALLDYIAVDQTKRGLGVGSHFLRLFLDTDTYLPKATCVLIEVEDPDSARNEKEAEKQKKRLHFYLKNGMIDTGVKVRAFWKDFLIMRMPLGDPDAKVGDIYRTIYRRIFSPLICAFLVRVKKEKQ